MIPTQQAFRMVVLIDLQHTSVPLLQQHRVIALTKSRPASEVLDAEAGGAQAQGPSGASSTV